MKTCNRCQKQKELSLFPKASTCKDGHRNYCKECYEQRKTAWRKANLEKVAETQKQWIANNLEKSKQIKQKWVRENPEYNKEYRREARKQQPQKYRAAVSARRKRVQQATPSWANMKEIRSFYEQCPDGYHVDHVIPLKGKTVSGLHVVGNLQYLPASENMRKGAKYASNFVGS